MVLHYMLTQWNGQILINFYENKGGKKKVLSIIISQFYKNNFGTSDMCKVSFCGYIFEITSHFSVFPFCSSMITWEMETKYLRGFSTVFCILSKKSCHLRAIYSFFCLTQDTIQRGAFNFNLYIMFMLNSYVKTWSW